MKTPQHVSLLFVSLVLLPLALGAVLLAAPGTYGEGKGAQVNPPAPPVVPIPTPIPWDDIRVDDCEEGRNLTNQALAVAGNNLYVVYYSPSYIYFTRSTDGGNTFVSSIEVDAWGVAPALARREGAGPEDLDLYIAFHEGHQTLFTRSTDAGSTWSPASIVYDGTAGGTWPTMPKLVVDAQGIVYVSWYYMTDGYGGPFFIAHSTDEGVSWSAPLTITEPYGNSHRTENCSLAILNGALYFSWMGYPAQWGNPPPHIFFTRSTDEGQSWLSPVRVDDAPQEFPGIQTMAMDVDPDGILYVQWSDDRLREGYPLPYMSHSTDDGTSWSPGVRVDDAGEHYQASGSGSLAAAAGGQVYIALEDGRNYWDYTYYLGWNDLFLAHSTNGGKTWAPNEQISDPVFLNLVFHPSTQLQNGVVYTVFEGYDVTRMHAYLWLDRHYDWPATPPPTRTPSPPALTWVPRLTSTPTFPSRTPTGLPSASATPTGSPGSTGTPEPTMLATATPSATATATPSPSPSATGTPTISPTPRSWRVGLPWVVVGSPGPERR